MKAFNSTNHHIQKLAATTLMIQCFSCFQPRGDSESGLTLDQLCLLLVFFLVSLFRNPRNSALLPLKIMFFCDDNAII